LPGQGNANLAAKNGRLTAAALAGKKWASHHRGRRLKVAGLKRSLKIAILALAAVLAAAFGSWFLATQGVTPQAAEPPLPVRQVATESVAPDADPAAKSVDAGGPVNAAAQAALAEKVSQAPEYQAFFARLRSLYPGDYNAALKAGAAQEWDRAENAPDLVLNESVRQLRATRGLTAAKAGGQALDGLFESHLKILRQLSVSDAALCVDFLNGAPAGRFSAFTGAHRALMADWASAGLEAIGDGAEKKIDREAPTPQDFDDLEKLLLDKGLDKPAVDLLLDGKEPNPPLTDEQECQNGIVYLDALKTLPDLQRLRLYALALEVMAHE
jgi:hypothetical protein